MQIAINQRLLLDIVNTWRLEDGFTYRGFKCGNCRRSLRRAWHHWLRTGGFKTPVHLCKDCQKSLVITYPKLNPKVRLIDFKGQKELSGIFSRLIARWNINRAPRLKEFNCDYCRRNIYKVNHMFVKLKSKISELHICRECWKKVKQEEKEEHILL